MKWSLSATSLLALLVTGPAQAGDWLHWRGPHQNGTSDETDLPTQFEPSSAAWKLDIAARGAPVVHGERVYVWGYRGKGADLYEVLMAVEASTGAVVWERQFRDFISDIIYDRYSIGSPTVDPETGNIYLMTSPGVVMGFSPDGEQLWDVSLMDAWGRLSFPNGRTGSTLVDGDLVIVHNITAFWGGMGPARDRFNAFDKRTGEPVWASTPGTPPKDSSFSTPYIDERDGRRLLYAGTGCGNVVAIDTRTGDPVWRIHLSAGGVNTSPVLVGDTLVATHAKENLDSSEIGRTVGIDVTGTVTPPEGKGTPLLEGEVWRNGLSDFSSSPVVADGVVYLVTMTGELTAVDPADGTVLWALKLAADQLHASPVYADGRLYVPMREGSFHVVKVSREGGTIESSVTFDGLALGAPSIANGRVFVPTTTGVYAFGEGKPAEASEPVPTDDGTVGKAVRLRVLPAELLLSPGQSQPIRAQALDALGRVVEERTIDAAERWIPPTAKVKAKMDATFADGAIVAGEDAQLSAGMWKVTAGDLEGTVRGRIVAGVPFQTDFEDVDLAASDDAGTAFAYPPLPWIGARFKWEVRELEGNKVFAKTLDRMLFQRSTVFMGHPEASDYRVQADVMTDGNRRAMGAIGVVNQRYRISLKANQRRLEISSNQERFKHGVRFDAQPGVWYRLVSEVRVDDDGMGTIYAKVWPRDEAEPADWTLTVTHEGAHTQGSPGLYGFSPQNLHKVYIDNIMVTPTTEDSP
jgi:outer membrane protein assembly factor BamB